MRAGASGGLLPMSNGARLTLGMDRVWRHRPRLTSRAGLIRGVVGMEVVRRLPAAAPDGHVVEPSTPAPIEGAALRGGREPRFGCEFIAGERASSPRVAATQWVQMREIIV